MGVKGLFQFLKRFEKNVYIPEYVKNKSVGIDIFWFLHKSKGDMMTLKAYLLPFIKYSKEVYFVFDGAPSSKKREMLIEQAQKRKKMRESIREIEEFLKYPFNRLTNSDRYHINDYLNQLKRQVWQPSEEYINNVKNWIDDKGGLIYDAEEEADDLLIELEQKGKIDIIVTNDSDLLVLGSQCVLRPVGTTHAAAFDKNFMCTILGFSTEQWDNFMYLCKIMNEKDVVLAYSLTSVYKDIDYILQKYSIICE
jgi:5'-3' exonuclease